MKGAENIDEAWHSAVETVPSQLRHHDITGPGMKRYCADGFQRQCYPHKAARVGDHLEQGMVAQVSYGSWPMCGIPEGAQMGHSTFRPLYDSREQPIYSELLEDNNVDALHSLDVHPICNQLRQYSLCHVYRLWQPDQLHQLLLGSVQDVLHWLLKYLKARQVKALFDNRFTSVPRYPGCQHFSKPFDSLKSGTWQSKEIGGMIQTPAVDCAQILVFYKDDGNTAAEKPYNEMVMGAMRALCEFSLLVSQQNHSNVSLKALHDALKRFYKKEGIFREQKMLKSAKAKVDDLLAMDSHLLCD